MLRSPPTSTGSITTTLVTANASANRVTPRTRRASPMPAGPAVANTGASARGANLVRPARATTAPRAGAQWATSSASVISRATRPSLELELAVYSVNGNAAHA